MNVQLRRSEGVNVERAIGHAVADCDIHPRFKSLRESLYPFLEKRWQNVLDTFGAASRLGYASGRGYPKAQPGASRRDSWPPAGGPPGSDLAFLKEQLLEAHGIELGILNFVGQNGQGFLNHELSAAFCRAVNDWLVAEWTSKESRLKASIVVPYENAEAAVAEIELRSGDPNFVQVLMHSRSSEPYGQPRYWPIYAAAERAGLPIGIHAFGYGGRPITSSGWPSYYIEEMANHPQSCQSLLTSMVIEGVFEKFPRLKVVLMESGFSWVPSLCWRLDKIWTRLKEETPHLKRLPSEYIREHVWLTTQPMEEPRSFRHLIDTIDWVGWDRLLFATDYPHWDFDDPAHALPPAIPPEKREKILLGNALEVYGVN